MGSSSSSAESAEATRVAFDKLGRKLSFDQVEYKVLLLGAGEAGKATLFRQLKQLFNASPYSEEERRAFGAVLERNVVEVVRSLCTRAVSEKLLEGDERSGDELVEKGYLVGAMLLSEVRRWSAEARRKEGEVLQGQAPTVAMDVREACRALAEMDVYDVKLTPELAKDIARVWKDPAVQYVYEQRFTDAFQMPINAPFYVERAQALSEKDFVPTVDDVMRARIRTTGIIEQVADVGDHRVKAVLVGGQRNERKKWIHCFENVTCVFFVVSLAGYCRVLFEDGVTNRLQEAMTLFEEIAGSRWFKDTSIVLFLNHKDEFKENLKKIRLNVCPVFSDLTEDVYDYDEAIKLLTAEFQRRYEASHTGKLLVHVTCMLSPEEVRTALHESVQYMHSEQLQSLSSSFTSS